MEPILEETSKKVRHLRMAIEAYQTAIQASKDYPRDIGDICNYMQLLRQLRVNLGLCNYFEYLAELEVGWIWKYKHHSSSTGWIYASPGSAIYDPGRMEEIVKRLSFRLEVLKWELGLTLAEEELANQEKSEKP